MPNLLTYLIAGLLGIGLQIFALQIPMLKKAAKNANHSFSFKEYWKDDFNSIVASIISVLILIIGLDEILGLKPELEKYVKWLFIFVGFTGSTIIMAVLSVVNKKIMAIVDIKTNKADGITPAVDAGNVEGVKEMEKDKAALKEAKQ